MESWQQRYNDMLFLAEKQKLEKELKVERKVAKTDLATRRREQLVNSKLDVSSFFAFCLFYYYFYETVYS